MMQLGAAARRRVLSAPSTPTACGAVAMMATPLLARRWTAVAVVVGLAVLAGCGGPADPAPIVDGLAYPDTWDLVLATEDEDTSCGELRCPTEIRYFQSEHNAARTCDEAQTAIGAAGRRPAGGAAVAVRARAGC